ncbi:MAG: sulfotransferase domain-containing protein, partial [Pseudomonadota bacterium]
LIRLMLRGLASGAPVPLSAIAHPQIGSLRGRYLDRFADQPRSGDLRAFLERLRDVQTMARAGGDVFLKTHAAAIRFSGMDYADWSATSSFIYVIRDPREVALSYAAHMGLDLAESVTRINAGDTALGAQDAFFEPLTTWSNHVKSWLSVPKTISRLVLRYEDVTRDRRKAVATLNAFYAFGRPQAVVDAVADALSFEALQEEERRDGFVEAVRGRPFFRAGERESWRREAPALMAPIAAANAEIMKTFNYV